MRFPYGNFSRCLTTRRETLMRGGQKTPRKSGSEGPMNTGSAMLDSLV